MDNEWVHLMGGFEVTLIGPVALFAHAHILRVPAARWMSLSPTVGSAIFLDTAILSTLGWERDARVIRTWNLACPLPSEDPVL